jgi:GNAT superfamily N-acetyltransferase
MNAIPLGVYRHYKGNQYEVIGFAKHSETLEDMVIYKALYGDGGTWVRPLSMWENLIEVDGMAVKRFEYIRYRSKDHEAFCLKGAADLYSTIGNLNLFMQCDAPNKDAFRALPDGYSFRLCRRDELEVWKRIVAEEQYVDYVTDFYNKVYAEREDEFFTHCLFVCNADDKPVASTFIWLAYKRINTVAWFRVLPEYEGKGLGRALLSEIIKDKDLPIYLHTQPTSARAVKLYSDFGFKLITDPIIGERKNDLADSLPHLQKVLPESDYAGLQFTEADAELLAAASTGVFAEF